nr:hypothetical protein BaRGS_017227 [Batillaria attramentaria]
MSSPVSPKAAVRCSSSRAIVSSPRAEELDLSPSSQQVVSLSSAWTHATQNPALLKAYYAAIGAQPTPRRQRSEKKPIPDEQKDDKYFERRRRNNGAAKRSRDLRKRREDEIAIRASMLEKENAILRAQAQHLREEAAALRRAILERQRR